MNKTQQKGNTKYKAVSVADMQSWWALGLISEEQISFLHRDRAQWVPHVMKSLRVGTGDAADRWLQFFSLLCTQELITSCMSSVMSFEQDMH